MIPQVQSAADVVSPLILLRELKSREFTLIMAIAIIAAAGISIAPAKISKSMAAVEASVISMKVRSPAE